MWARRSFAVKVTAVSFAFTAAMMFSLAAVQQSLQSEESGPRRLFGLPIPLPDVEGPTASLALFSVAVLMWAALLSLSQLVVARQVRGYISQAASSMSTSMEFLSERMMIEAYLGVLANAARTLALTLVLVYLLPRAVVIGLVLALAVAGLLCVRRFRRASVLQGQWRDASRAWRQEPSPGSRAAVGEAMYARDVYLHRIPMGQLALVLSVVLIAVVLPAWVQGAAAGGASLLIMLVWIQALLGTVVGAGNLGWRWAHRSHAGSRGDADDEA